MNVRGIIRTIGTQQYVADLMGVTRQSVKMWCSRNSVPIARVGKLSKLAGVKPEHLNPELEKIARKR